MGLFDKFVKKKKPKAKSRSLTKPAGDFSSLRSGLAERRITRTFDKPVEPTAEPTPDEAVEAEQEAEPQTRQWIVLNALYAGSAEQAAAEAAESEGEEVSFLNGAIALWNGESAQAERLLSEAAQAGCEIIKCWGHLKLAELYLELGRDSLADRHLSRARRYSYEDRQGRHRLSILVDLADARIDIERGAAESAEHTLDALLETCSDEYLRAAAFYLKGCLGRFKAEGDKAEQISHLQKAVRVFAEKGDRYHTALAELELSDCAMELEAAGEWARGAAAEFEALGRRREADAARARLFELQNMTADSFGCKSRRADFVAGLVAASPQMRAALVKLRKAALEESLPVLITGPRGSGKEMAAKALHALGRRSSGPMIAINCAAIPEHLAESELFGYEKGAFTGAGAQKEGIFEAADGGTLFLDEIGELPLPMQAKLLRVLQDGTFRRLGAKTEIRTSARIVAATNRDPYEMARQGKFREDLLDRLSFKVRIPPLDSRREDILPLAEHFLNKRGEGKYRFDAGAKAYLLDLRYPGNVRMLESVVANGIINAREAGGSVVTSALLLDEEEDDAQSEPEFDFNAVTNLEEATLLFERSHIVRVLAKFGGNKREARKALGVSRSAFWRSLKKHGIKQGQGAAEEFD